MPSELQRVARGLVDCFDEIPRVVDQLVRTAARCRENAQVALIASRGQATVAAQQLDAAARACEAAAHYLSMAPPKARGWAEGLIGTPGPSTNRPSSDSADRNKATSGTGDVQVRTRRLTATYDDLEVAEDNEPPLVTVARKALEKYRKAHEKDDDQERDDENLLELEITVTETGEVIFEEPDKKEEQKRAERLTRDFEFVPESDEAPEVEEPDEREEEKRAERLARDFEIDPDLTEAVKLLLDSMADAATEKWEHATLTITPTQIEATFDDPEQPPAPPIVNIDLPDLPTPNAVDFDPAFDLRPLELDFAPGVHDPLKSFKPHERLIAERLTEEGWRIDARREDHGSGDKNPDAMVRKQPDGRGVVVEFKTPNKNGTSTVKRNICDASDQAPEIVIDGRDIDLSEADAWRAYRRALGQPGKAIADVVHVILGDNRLVTYRKEK
ncbi:hypothetical protein [Kribbella sp. VKM Ac-2566]|uniref:CdiA C-terminal domain-containing protein n=1 Tax=Kribbella sp. VKM Ac-2566 TaxID=2512218 RepID=UPI0010624080|nr:hypothetical protein [Kribbella sp. VKM Ac-2566]TDW79366.1 hypothetical protein EV647_8169 [Kribbella sp. VKM Ac-2566]